jgi:hypothetical protein
MKIRTGFGINIIIDQENKKVEVENELAGETTIITRKGTVIRI